MRICIVGAGAIGGLLGVKLALAGAEVTLIARGAHLAAIQRDGLALTYDDGRREVAHPVLATDDMRAAGPQEYVIVAVKAQSLAGLVEPMRVLYGPDTAVVYAQNGIPWWYFQQHGGPYEGRRIETVDPGGVIAAATEIERVIGCVVYPAATISSPGVIRHIEGNRFTLGEPNGERSERVVRLSRLMTEAGLKAPPRPDIRNELWLKLWGNLSFNPISALTRATVDRIIADPLARTLAERMMAEAQTVAETLGIRFPVSIERRIKMAEDIGAHKTSMLQDIEAGRRTEIDALVGAVTELGRLTGTPTPHLDAVYANVKLLEQIVTTR
ncbi:2-dehydropantoate 2-reductase [Candidatus Chloroploca sp. M-50]|uniref:2-dehydropantoate 2-reductase n=1 Tax=Candidatus Chloroploca mongolica TaxID=2528176 RepID=A0ABS4DGM7_9CHLR|nr:2-dehydropantoate 2-reductase [Candidatus Chloroploca mongolica]MBP1468539.1 2-dehydropantoate 2-reductase [Candidatus Chloroploca mongolica]